MSLLQENVYFFYRKVNKNAYFTLFEVNKNVNLVIFNMSKIAFCRFATLVVIVMLVILLLLGEIFLPKIRINSDVNDFF